MGEVLASVWRKGPARSRSGTYRAKEGDGFLMAAQCIFDARLDLGFWVGQVFTFGCELAVRGVIKVAPTR